MRMGQVAEDIAFPRQIRVEDLIRIELGLGCHPLGCKDLRQIAYLMNHEARIYRSKERRRDRLDRPSQRSSTWRGQSVTMRVTNPRRLPPCATGACGGAWRVWAEVDGHHRH